MKKFLIAGLFFVFICPFVYSDEITEDYFDMATNFCINGDYAQATEFLNKILLLEPNNKKIQDLRNGLVQIQKGGNRSYIASKYPAVNKSLNAYKNGDKQGEINALSEANDYWSNYFLADYYRRNNDRTKAISYFIKSVNEKPTFVQCYLQIALCYFEMGQYQQALTYLNQYLKLNQEDDFAYALRAKIYNFLGDNTSALSEIITAIAIENNEEYRFIECKILYDLKRYVQAKEKLTNLKWETAEYYKYLGLCDAALGNDADAILNLEKSIILYDGDKIVNSKYNELKLKVESK